MSVGVPVDLKNAHVYLASHHLVDVYIALIGKMQFSKEASAALLGTPKALLNH